MKHYLQNSLRALFLSLAVLLSLPMLAVEVEIGGINYDLNTETKQATVIKKSSGTYSGEIVIPESVEYGGTIYSVTSIGEDVFWCCYGLTSVTIGNSVVSIGSGAFWSCSGLTSVTIGNSVTSIGYAAFYSCSGLTSMTIPNSVESIGGYAFRYCKGLNSIAIGNSVESIGESAFEFCSGLTSVHISDLAMWCNIHFNDYNSNPLYYAHHLYLNEEVKDLVIPNSVTRIGDYVFDGCSGLTSVTIPNSVTSIGEMVFRNCSGLTSVTIPNSVTSIGSSAFSGCSGLTSITIPNSVTSIGDYAFCECTGMTSVTIGNGVESIGGSVFKDCSSLTSVTIGNAVTSIGNYAFKGCAALISLTIPNSVTTIIARAFSGCSALTSVTIGNSVEYIGSEAFADCPELLNVYCYAEKLPSTYSNAFNASNPENATLHVPTASVESYKATEPWSNFGKIVTLSDEETGETADAIRYIALNNGHLYAIPEKYILSENQSGNVMTLSLTGGEEWSYNISDVVSVGNQYEVTKAELTSFGFTHEDNDQVYKDVIATITEENDTVVVRAEVPVIGKRLRPSFVTSEASGLYSEEGQIVSGKSHFRFTSPMTFTLAQDNHYIYTVNDVQVGEFKPLGRPCKIDVKYLTDYATGTYKIPTVYITFGDDTTRWDDSQWIGMYTYNSDGDWIWTKEEWIEGCTFQLDGAGIWPDIDKVEDCEIRGRGNSSWSQSYRSKNPFRIKFPKKNKQSPFNLTEDRQWVFIANKQDGSMTSNSIAQKIAAMVDAEALCHMIPVDVYINGHYRGSYCFTEKIGIADNSVAIDEAIGCLLELDDYFDETFKFRDDAYGLPVNIKDPDFSEEDDERVVTYNDIVASVNDMTTTLMGGGDVSEYVDMETWAKFWLVNDLVRNVETHHPKSCYLFNENPAEGEKWKFGPAWDFDWAFGYEDDYTYFIAGAEEDLYSEAAKNNRAGYQFYNALRKSEAAREAYLKEWNKFMEEDRLQELMEYIDDYTEFAQYSIEHNNDAEIREMNNTDYFYQAELSKQWLTRRANFIYSNMQSSDTPDSDEITTNIFIRSGIRYRILSDSTVEVYGLAYDYMPDEVEIPTSVSFCGVTFSVVAIGDAAFEGCSSLSNITLPEGITRIGDKAFYACTSLSSITFPSTLSSIGSEAFMECHTLSEATSMSTNIVIGTDCFTNIPYDDAVLHVIVGTKKRYIYTGWGQYFGTIVEDVMSDDVITYKIINIGTAQSSMVPGTWYFLHNSRIPNSTAVDFSEPGEEIKSAGGFVQDNGIEKSVLMSNTALIDAAKENGLYEYECNNVLVRFVPVEGVPDAFKVQFATGNWLKNLNFYNGSGFTTTDLESEATHFNFYLIDGNERGRFGWNIYDMQERMDNNGAGQTLVLWGNGEISGVMTGNNVWQIYDAVINDGQILESFCIEDGAMDSYKKASEQQCTTLEYRRTFPNLLWNCLYVPFKIPYATLADDYDVAYINGMNSYDRNDDGQIDDIRMEVIKIKQGTLKANHPYLIKPKNDGAKNMNLVLKDATLYASKITTLDCSSVYVKYDITGTYNTMTSEEIGESLVLTTSGSWQKMLETAVLKPFRFYLTISNREGSPLEIEQEALSRIRICVWGEDDNATGIDDAIHNADMQDTPIYDLSGRRVKKPAKDGMYISNGQKLIY